MSETIVNKSHKLIGFKKFGILITTALLDNNTMIRSASLVFMRKILLDISIANDGGWYGDNKKIYNFHYDKRQHALFIRWLAIGFRFLRKDL